MNGKVRILAVGVGTVGIAHAKAYHALAGFEVCGLMSRSIRPRRDLPAELEGYPLFEDFSQALAERPRDNAEATRTNVRRESHDDGDIDARDRDPQVRPF